MSKDMMLTDNYTHNVFERQKCPIDSFFNATYREIKGIKDYSVFGEQWQSATEVDQLRSGILNELQIEQKRAFFNSKDSTKRGEKLHAELFNGQKYNSRIFSEELKYSIFNYSLTNEFDYVLVINSFELKTRKPFESWAHVCLHVDVYYANGEKMFGGKSYYPFRITKKMFVNPVLYFSKRGIQLYVEHLIQLMIAESK
jgi:hypothetical protein